MDDKVKRRLAQNREAARKSRQRRKAYVQNLEEEVGRCPPLHCVCSLEPGLQCRYVLVRLVFWGSPCGRHMICVRAQFWRVGSECSHGVQVRQLRAKSLTAGQPLGGQSSSLNNNSFQGTATALGLAGDPSGLFSAMMQRLPGASGSLQGLSATGLLSHGFVSLSSAFLRFPRM
jgi:hypothetical protein